MERRVGYMGIEAAAAATAVCCSGALFTPQRRFMVSHDAGGERAGRQAALTALVVERKGKVTPKHIHVTLCCCGALLTPSVWRCEGGSASRQGGNKFRAPKRPR
jgi:hypothetical protein